MRSVRYRDCACPDVRNGAVPAGIPAPALRAAQMIRGAFGACSGPAIRSHPLRGSIASGRNAALGAFVAVMLLATGMAHAGCEPSADAAETAAADSAFRPQASHGAAAPPTLQWLAEVADLGAEHVVAAGDSLTSVGARYGVSPRRVAEANGLDPGSRLRVGQRLFVQSRHLAPLAAGLEDGIVVNLPQRMAFLFRAGRLARAYPVAVGRPDWPTPTGEFTVRTREQDKTWYVPKSIQEEMRREGKPVLAQVPPGPDNPLGRHWIGLSLPAIGIHGTNAPASVYGLRSHGCLRMHPDDVAELFDRVAVGERGRIVYEPLLLGRDAGGAIWFEANPDAYRRGAGSVDTVRAMARERGIAEDSVDWALVAAMLQARDGQAREVGPMGSGGNR